MTKGSIISTRCAAAIAFVLLLTGAARAESLQSFASLPSASAPATLMGAARPVLAWTRFCADYAAECTVDAAEPEIVTLGPATWQTIVAVNRKVNSQVKPLTDAEHWGIADRWDLAEDGFGDCEDYQLLKRKLLVEAGFPRRAMRMTVVIDEKNEGHAVLMVRTDRGDLILDNKRNAVLPWAQTGYVYVKRESASAIGWVSLGGAVSPVVTANQ